MSSEFIAKHYERLEELMRRKGTPDPALIFNLDKSSFSMRGMTLGRINCVVKRVERGNTSAIQLKGMFDHVTAPLFRQLVKV